MKKINSLHFSPKAAMKVAANEVVSSGVAMAANIVVARSVRTTGIAAVNTADAVWGKVAPQTADVKRHRWSKAKTMPEAEALALVNKGKAYAFKSNRKLADPVFAGKVQNVIDGVALGTGAVTAVKVRKGVKDVLSGKTGLVVNCDNEFEDIPEEEL